MKYFLLISVFLMGNFCYAQNNQQLLSRLQSKFGSVKDLSADFINHTGGSLPLKGKFFYKKGNKYKAQFKSALIISDGATIWNYNKKNNKVVISEIGSGNFSLSLDKIFIDYPKNSRLEDLGKEQIAGSDAEVVKLFPKNSQVDFVKLWLDKNTLPVKVEIRNKDGNVYFFEMSNIRINQNLNDADFKFETPKGCEVIDLR